MSEIPFLDYMVINEEQLLKSKHARELLLLIRKGIELTGCETISDVQDLLQGMLDGANAVIEKGVSK